MSAEVEELPAEAHVPYARRAEWADVEPRRLPPLPEPVVQIAPDEVYGDLMPYFWAAVESEEHSERVLQLTGEIILHLNSANYTVWEWRWRCIEALGGIVAHAGSEQALMRAVADENPKNYQLWNHRRRCALAEGPTSAERELAFCEACLQEDAKNYHAWAHRQAMLSSFGPSGHPNALLWAAELRYATRLLVVDARNNSAWAQRAFVVGAAPEGAAGGLSARELYDSEVEFTLAQLSDLPHNESAWSYLAGLAARAPGAPELALATDERLEGAAQEALEDSPGCAPALRLLAEVRAAQAELLLQAAADDGSGGSTGAAEWLEAARAASGEAAALLQGLQVADPLRRGFYQQRERQLPAA